ncbi:autophagy-related protein 33 [Geosmithia morbida]|uniref:Autophagy-related protein 33 n=1 Tax=Geosmithia morbida TaxID=1094350 RepID=A0A9P5D1I5_9HYPO|nr:autophagy-related protein 33 [Geosmithia morbida]KAF4123948.1 autophagy-related protein 33 [Geosmithia morbida]
MQSSAVSAFKFVGTVSLGLLTGVSYSVSGIAIPAILTLPSALSASLALTNLTSYARLPILALTSLSSVPLLLSYALSPRSARHPYLIYSSLLAVFSAAAPLLVSVPEAPARPEPTRKQQKRPVPSPRPMEASYEVLGEEMHVAEEEEEEEEEGTVINEQDDYLDTVNGEEIRAEALGSSRTHAVRTGLAAVGFLMSVVGIWGDGVSGGAVYVL